MNLALLLGITFFLFIFAYRFYARFLGKVFGENPSRLTPAYTQTDGIDYIPTKPHILFAHHFSAVAGAGPILGPTMALLYGALPAWLWIILGGVFLGAVHDFSALFVSIRERGRSIAEVARTTLGNTGFNLYITFILIMVGLVTSSFLIASATSLTSMWPLEKLGLTPAQTFLKTVTLPDGTIMGRIGGIASTSVLIITLCSPILGYLLYKRNLSVKIAYPLATVICVLSVIAGFYYPVTLDLNQWMLFLSIYVLFAAAVPVWMILQPRDFINVQILYAGILLLIISLIRSGFSGITLQAPLMNIHQGMERLGALWPMLFVTIACGAISGFHGLVASGTTSKQIKNETQAKTIGYLGMLGESTLGVCVTLAVAAGLSFSDYQSIVWPTDPGARSNPILGFSLGAANIFYRGLGIPIPIGVIFGILLVEGFVITTLDVAVRLNRYLMEELWRILLREPPKWLMHPWFNAGIAVFVMWFIAYKNAFNAVWPIFGAANQLLAALSLIAVSIWFYRAGRKTRYTLIPAFFIIVTTIASLGVLLQNYWKSKNWILITADALLLLLSIGVILAALRSLRRPAARPLEPADGPAGKPPLSKCC
ncbi:MAG: carbon starvation protein A [Candidatus Omnitrophica bacterium]|nr:carbon starvation protein A [Candidatus Omnitrophota bacterium]